MTTDAKEDRCEACFGTGQMVEMRAARFGQKITPPPECKACNGTGRREVIYPRL
jgi:hypothetical protein